MSGTGAVYQKEIATYFRSPIAYYVVAVFLLGSGYFFLYNIFLGGETAMAGTFQNMGVLLLTLAPVISMRLMATEYSAGTAELLLTLPLSPWQIVLGKFLSAVTILLLIIAGTLVDLIPLYLFGTPETTTILAGYIGFLLLGLACLRGGPALLDRDPQPDRGRPAHRRGAAGLLVRRAPAEPSRPRRSCEPWSAISRSRFTSPTSSRASFAPRASSSTWSSPRSPSP